jgi:hypothetical protein
MNHNAKDIFNLLGYFHYAYDAAHYLQSNNLDGKIKLKKPMLILDGDLPIVFMGYELIWV